MKMSTEDFSALKKVISILDTPDTRDSYRSGRFYNADKVKDLDKRYRWDLYYAAKGYRFHAVGLKDDHIDTALRKIVDPL